MAEEVDASRPQVQLSMCELFVMLVVKAFESRLIRDACGQVADVVLYIEVLSILALLQQLVNFVIWRSHVVIESIVDDLLLS